MTKDHLQLHGQPFGNGEELGGSGQLGGGGVSDALSWLELEKSITEKNGQGEYLRSQLVQQAQLKAESQACLKRAHIVSCQHGPHIKIAVAAVCCHVQH